MRDHGPVLCVMVGCALVGASVGRTSQHPATEPGDAPTSHTQSDSASSPASETTLETGIAGRVTTPRGPPTEPCGLSAEAISWFPPPVPEIGRMTDDQGRFTESFPEATYTIGAHCDEGEGEVGDVVVTEGSVTTVNITVD